MMGWRWKAKHLKPPRPPQQEPDPEDGEAGGLAA